MERPPLIEARGITRSVGRVVALRGAAFAAWPGKGSALVGDNGAGKSTLITIFSGRPTPLGKGSVESMQHRHRRWHRWESDGRRRGLRGGSWAKARQTTSELPAQQTPVLEARGISKSFGHVHALEDVSIELFPSEVLGLVGDNGAGKSTLIKILSGAYLPDHGEIKLHGKPVVFHDPGEARHAGIETVYQDLALAPHLEVAANVFLGREIPRTGLLGQLGFLDHPAMRQQAAQQLRDLRVNVKSIRQTVNQLSGGQRQSVAVARAVSWGKDIIIMDEPTAALGVAQAGMVLELILRVKQAGVSVILISHNMPHVFQVADRMIVLRQGRRVATVNPHEVSMEHVVSLMTGAVTIGGHVAGGG